VSFAPTTVREDEYDDLMSFLEESYGHPQGFFQHHYPARWPKDKVDFENCFIIREGRIASHVRVFPMRLVFGGREVTIGGIGGVATHPDFRGKGHMRALMTHTSDVMLSRGYPFAVLWGNRQRYLHFGYERCGCESLYSFTPRSVKAGEAQITKYNGEKSLFDTVVAMHDTESQRVARTPADYEAMLGAPGMETFISSAGTGAYVTLFNIRNGWRTAEVGGDASAIPALLAQVMKECSLDGINIHRPLVANALTNAIYRVADSWNWHPFGSLKILSLKGTLEFFCDQLYKKREKLGIPAEGTVTFKVKETGECATVSFSGTMACVTGESSGNVVELSEQEAAYRLFGTPGSLEFYIPMLDHV
jgi:GNAT superfamily N-acetyltransferase